MATLAEIEAEIARRKTGGNASRLRMLDAEIERRKQAYLAETPPQAPPEMRLNPETGQMVDLEQMARLDRSKEGGMGYAADLAGQYVRGTPFIGEYADEAAGKVTSAFGGDGDLLRDRARARVDTFEQDNPKAAMAAQMTGGIVGSLPLITAMPLAAAAKVIPASMLGKTLAGIGLGTTGGAVEGYIGGYGAGVDPDSRRGTASQRAIIQGLAGAALGGGAPWLQKGIKNGSDYAIDYFKNGQVRKSLGMSKPASEMMGDALESGGAFGQPSAPQRTFRSGAAVRESLNNTEAMGAGQAAGDVLGDGYTEMQKGGANMLADASPNARALLDTAVQKSKKAGSMATNVIEKRAADSRMMLDNTMDGLMGKPRGPKEILKEISQDTAAGRGTTYRAAYASDIDYLGPKGQAVSSVVDRIPPKTLRDAVEKANTQMHIDGVINEQMKIIEIDGGMIKISQPPNVRQLDMVKRALDAMGRVTNDGRPTFDALQARGLAKELRDTLKVAAPDYEKAIAAGFDKLSQDEALKAGRAIFAKKTNLEDVVEYVARFDKPQIRRMGEGIRAEIDKTMAVVKRAVTDGNMDAREAGEVLRLLSSRDNMNKVAAVLGKQKTDILKNSLRKATKALELRASVADNSKTFVRHDVDKRANEMFDPGFAENLVKLKPLAAKDAAISAMTKTAKIDKQKKVDALFSEIVGHMTTGDGAAKLDALRRLSQMAPANDAIANKLSIGATTGVGALGYTAASADSRKNNR